MSKHGGAWKVAYADFITAMMALFMVLWILGSEQELLEQMQEYFRNPPSPWDRQSGKFLVETGDSMGILDEGEAQEAFFERMDPSVIRGLMDAFYKSLQINTQADEIPPVEMILTSDGLRMIIYNRNDSPMFEKGGDVLTPWGEFLVQNMAWLLSRHSFNAVIEGHAEAGIGIKTTPDGDSYGPWELSVDRANRVRRKLEFYAGGEVGIDEVAGFGDSAPLPVELQVPGRTHQRITVSLTLPQTHGNSAPDPN